MYLYDMPYKERMELCRILDYLDSGWKHLAGSLGFTALEVSVLSNEVYKANGSPTDKILEKMGMRNCTVDELACKLKQIQALRALQVIKALVSKSLFASLMEERQETENVPYTRSHLPTPSDLKPASQQSRSEHTIEWTKKQTSGSPSSSSSSSLFKKQSLSSSSSSPSTSSSPPPSSSSSSSPPPPPSSSSSPPPSMEQMKHYEDMKTTAVNTAKINGRDDRKREEANGRKNEEKNGKKNVKKNGENPGNGYDKMNEYFRQFDVDKEAAKKGDKDSEEICERIKKEDQEKNVGEVEICDRIMEDNQEKNAGEVEICDKLMEEEQKKNAGEEQVDLMDEIRMMQGMDMPFLNSFNSFGISGVKEFEGNVGNLKTQTTTTTTTTPTATTIAPTTTPTTPTTTPTTPTTPSTTSGCSSDYNFSSVTNSDLEDLTSKQLMVLLSDSDASDYSSLSKMMAKKDADRFAKLEMLRRDIFE